MSLCTCQNAPSTPGQNSDNTKCWERSEDTGLLMHCWWGCKMVESGKHFSKPSKMKYATTIRSANCLTFMPEKWRRMFTWKSVHMFIEALLVTAKSWKKFRCPSMGEWLNKLWYIHTVEYYLVNKKENSIPTTTWVNFQRITLSEKIHLRLCSIWLHSCKIMEMTRYGNGEWISGWQGLKAEGRWVWLEKGNRRDPGGDGMPCTLTALTSKSWLWHSVKSFQDVITGEISVKGTFHTTACDYSDLSTKNLAWFWKTHTRWSYLHEVQRQTNSWVIEIRTAISSGR